MVNSWIENNRIPALAIRESRVEHTTNRKVSSPFPKLNQWRLARMIFFMGAFLILFSGFTFMHTSASTEQTLTATSQELSISADDGDTLWQIARTYKRDGMDTRKAVYYIMERNGLSSSGLKSGQSLIIPSRIRD